MARVFLTGTGIYNLDAIRRDFDISRKEFCGDLGISTGTYRMYILQGMVIDKLMDLVKVEPIAEAATETTTAE